MATRAEIHEAELALEHDAPAERALRRAYAEQLHEIGDLLVRWGMLTEQDVARHGVRFALRARYESKEAMEKALLLAEGEAGVR